MDIVTLRPTPPSLVRTMEKVQKLRKQQLLLFWQEVVLIREGAYSNSTGMQWQNRRGTATAHMRATVRQGSGGTAGSRMEGHVNT